MLIFLCSLAMSYGARTLAQDLAASSLRKPARVVFVCEHGSVKSLIAMDYFNRSARKRGLKYRAVARGTAPEATVPGPVREGLRGDGFVVSGFVPRLFNASDVAKLGMEDWLQWGIAGACFLVTVILQSEVALLFIGAGTLGALYYGTLWRRPPSTSVLLVVIPVAPVVSSSLLAKILLFFLKAGALTFGSGLVIVPFLQQGVVQEHGWLGEREFLIAVAIGTISPGPVVITATFVGYLVAGFWGAVAATVGIFLPSFILVLVAAPILQRHRANRNVQGFVKVAYAAAIGTILGASILLGRIAIGDWLTILIGLASLAVLIRWKVSNPLLMATAAMVGLIAFPLLQPAWVMVR
jgi:chromate transporter